MSCIQQEQKQDASKAGKDVPSDVPSAVLLQTKSQRKVLQQVSNISSTPAVYSIAKPRIMLFYMTCLHLLGLLHLVLTFEHKGKVHVVSSKFKTITSTSISHSALPLTNKKVQGL